MPIITNIKGDRDKIMTKSIKLSVKDLIDYVMRSGDINVGFMGSNRSVLGIKAHQKVQKLMSTNLQEDMKLIIEHPIDYKSIHEGFEICIEGRIDGIIENKDKIIIDEIKSTYSDFENLPEDGYSVHWAQAICYSYFYAKENDLDNVFTQLTYFQLKTEEIKSYIREYTFEQLESIFCDYLNKYLIWHKITREWKEVRDKSIEDCTFPYEKYRKGQREFAVATYKTIQEGKKIFIQAPTGIGKTISAIFPTIKIIVKGQIDKFFYLTSRTTQRSIVEASLKLMINKGLKIKSITITAKDKMCFKDKTICKPDYCQYALGYYDRIGFASKDLFENENIVTRDIIEKYAVKHNVCPYEFTLDASLWADCIICDYNYVFDPIVYLKRYFSDKLGKYVFLVDEAHNLVDRAREMYSSDLDKKDILQLKRNIQQESKKQSIIKTLNKLNRFFIDKRKECVVNDQWVTKDKPKEIYAILKDYINEAELWLSTNHSSFNYDAVFDLYMKVNFFIKISELYDESYITYYSKEKSDVIVKLFCVNPSTMLKNVLKRGLSVVFFSATLSPIEYFKDILGGDSDDYIIRMKSPFNRANLGLFIEGGISTKYKNRELSYNDIVNSIYTVINGKMGNYMVFFPSYKYMIDVYNIFSEEYPNISTSIQNSSMTESEREVFLDKFKEDCKQTYLAFVVLGGIFSEGIDLVGERLSGAIIVGVGLPQICLERNIIKDYFDTTISKGFEYSYIYPGMNKVMQGAGRVIRSDKDKGIVLLIDERYLYYQYNKLFPYEWKHYKTVRDSKSLEKRILSFWKDNKV